MFDSLQLHNMKRGKTAEMRCYGRFRQKRVGAFGSANWCKMVQNGAEKYPNVSPVFPHFREMWGNKLKKMKEL